MGSHNAILISVYPGNGSVHMCELMLKYSELPSSMLCNIQCVRYITFLNSKNI